MRDSAFITLTLDIDWVSPSFSFHWMWWKGTLELPKLFLELNIKQYRILDAIKKEVIALIKEIVIDVLKWGFLTPL